MEESCCHIKKVLRKNRNKWIRSDRQGNTAVGKLFEDLLGKIEDNKSMADLDGLEVKAKRVESKLSLVSLFTMKPSVPIDTNGRLYSTVSGVSPNNKGLMLSAKSDGVYLDKYNASGKKIGKSKTFWSEKSLKRVIREKIKTMVLVEAKSRFRWGKEEFMYDDATFFTGMTYNRFIKGINDGLIVLDIRMSGKHDHGCAFRIRKSNLKNVFSNVQVLN